jgi:hypothetical protein
VIPVAQQSLLVITTRSAPRRGSNDLIGAALSAVELQSGFFSQFLPEGYRPYMVMAWPPLMLTLRELTNTALADK